MKRLQSLRKSQVFKANLTLQDPVFQAILLFEELTPLMQTSWHKLLARKNLRSEANQKAARDLSARIVKLSIKTEEVTRTAWELARRY